MADTSLAKYWKAYQDMRQFLYLSSYFSVKQYLLQIELYR